MQEQENLKHLSSLHCCAHNNPSAYQVVLLYPKYTDFPPV